MTFRSNPLVLRSEIFQLKKIFTDGKNSIFFNKQLLEFLNIIFYNRGILIRSAKLHINRDDLIIDLDLFFSSNRIKICERKYVAFVFNRLKSNLEDLERIKFLKGVISNFTFITKNVLKVKKHIKRRKLLTKKFKKFYNKRVNFIKIPKNKPKLDLFILKKTSHSNLFKKKVSSIKKTRKILNIKKYNRKRRRVSYSNFDRQDKSFFLFFKNYNKTHLNKFFLGSHNFGGKSYILPYQRFLNLLKSKKLYFRSKRLRWRWMVQKYFNKPALNFFFVNLSKCLCQYLGFSSIKFNIKSSQLFVLRFFNGIKKILRIRFRRFLKNKDFRKFCFEGLECGFLIARSIEKGSAFLLGQYIKLLFRLINIRKHFVIVKFLNKLLKSIVNFKPNVVKGLRIVLSGRIGRRRRKKKIMMTKGNVVLQTFSTKIDYYQSFVIHSQGCLGFKVLIAYK
jgi:hypothetical protein